MSLLLMLSARGYIPSLFLLRPCLRPGALLLFTETICNAQEKSRRQKCYRLLWSFPFPCQGLPGFNCRLLGWQQSKGRCRAKWAQCLAVCNGTLLLASSLLLTEKSSFCYHYQRLPQKNLQTNRLPHIERIPLKPTTSRMWVIC